MNSPIVPNKDLLQVFIKNSLIKIQELNGLVNILIKEGPKPELLEAIFRTTLTIKSFASTCNLNRIVDFMTTVIDVQFDQIRTKNRQLTEFQKQDVKNNLTIIKNMVNELQPYNLDPRALSENTKSTSENLSHLDDKRTTLLQTIGQLSVWSFHDILNSLAKIEGFSDMIAGELEQLSGSQVNIKEEIKLNLNKTLENTKLMTNLINQIRVLRGKTIYEQKDFRIKELIKDIQESMAQPQKNVPWSLSTVPDVLIHCDRSVFSQLWAHLWRLLKEWQIPGAQLHPALAAQLTQGENKPDTKFKHRLFLYIWIEKPDSIKFLPENLLYSKQTPFPDLANVFYFTTKIAEKTEIEVSCAKTPSGNALFRIEFPCTDVGQELTGAAPRSDEIILKNSMAKPSSTKSVLVVDDEKDLRTILSVKINRMGYAVHTAANIQEAVQILNEKDISLVISDLLLQEESGLDLMKSLSAARPDVPFVFITGADEDDVPSSIFDILSKYAKAFLTKPVATNVLKEAIEKIIGPADKN